MTSEIKQAFAHPEVRSQETAGDEPLDRISVRNHVVEVEIGAFQIERGITQRLSFDIVVEVRPSSGSKTDDVDDILSYDRVTEAISAELAHERQQRPTVQHRHGERLVVLGSRERGHHLGKRVELKQGKQHQRGNRGTNKRKQNAFNEEQQRGQF